MQCNRKELLRAVELAAKVGGNAPLGLSVQGDRLHLKANHRTALGVWSSVEIKIEASEEAQDLHVSANDLASRLKTFTSDDISVQLRDKCEISYGPSGYYRIPKTTNYTTEPELPYLVSDVDEVALKAALELCIPVAGNKVSHALDGVYFTFIDEKLIVSATNGAQLHRYDCGECSVNDWSAPISKSAAKIFASILTDNSNAGIVVSGNRIGLHCGYDTAYSVVSTGHSIDFESLFSATANATFKVVAGDFAMLAGSAALCSTKANFAIGSGLLQVNVFEPEDSFGDVQRLLPVFHEGYETELTINPAAVAETFGALPASSEVEVSFCEDRLIVKQGSFSAVIMGYAQ